MFLSSADLTSWKHPFGLRRRRRLRHPDGFTREIWTMHAVAHLISGWIRNKNERHLWRCALRNDANRYEAVSRRRSTNSGSADSVSWPSGRSALQSALFHHRSSERARVASIDRYLISSAQAGGRGGEGLRLRGRQEALAAGNFRAGSVGQC